MQKLFITKEKLPSECGTCKNAIVFNPNDGYCSKCKKFTLRSTRKVFNPLIYHKIRMGLFFLLSVTMISLGVFPKFYYPDYLFSALVLGVSVIVIFLLLVVVPVIMAQDAYFRNMAYYPKREKSKEEILNDYQFKSFTRILSILLFFSIIPLLALLKQIAVLLCFLPTLLILQICGGSCPICDEPTTKYDSNRCIKCEVFFNKEAIMSYLNDKENKSKKMITL
jgi:hypothetical protein